MFFIHGKSRIKEMRNFERISSVLGHFIPFSKATYVQPRFCVVYYPKDKTSYDIYDISYDIDQCFTAALFGGSILIIP